MTLKNNNWFQTGFLKHSNFNQCPHLLLVRQTSSPTPNICYWLCHKLTNWTAQTNILIAPQSFSVSLLVKIKLLTWLTIEVLLNREKSILTLGEKIYFWRAKCYFTCITDSRHNRSKRIWNSITACVSAQCQLDSWQHTESRNDWRSEL